MVLAVATLGPELLAGTQSGTVERFDRDTGAALPPLLALDAPPGQPFAPTVRALAVSPTERRCAVASSDDLVRIVDPTGAVIHTLPEVGVQAVAFLDDDELLLGNLRGELVRTALDGRQRYRHQLEYDPVYALALDPDTSRVALGFRSSRVHVRTLADGGPEQVLVGHLDSVYGLAWLGSRQLVTASKDKRLLRWTLPEPEPEILYRGDHYVTAVGTTPGLVAFAAADHRIRLVEATTGQLVAELPGHTAPIQVLTFLDGGQTLVSAGNDAQVLIWDLGPLLRRTP